MVAEMKTDKQWRAFPTPRDSRLAQPDYELVATPTPVTYPYARQPIVPYIDPRLCKPTLPVPPSRIKRSLLLGITVTGMCIGVFSVLVCALYLLEWERTYSSYPSVLESLIMWFIGKVHVVTYAVTILSYWLLGVLWYSGSAHTVRLRIQHRLDSHFLEQGDFSRVQKSSSKKYPQLLSQLPWNKKGRSVSKESIPAQPAVEVCDARPLKEKILLLLPGVIGVGLPILMVELWKFAASNIDTGQLSVQRSYLHVWKAIKHWFITWCMVWIVITGTTIARYVVNTEQAMVNVCELMGCVCAIIVLHIWYTYKSLKRINELSRGILPLETR